MARDGKLDWKAAMESKRRAKQTVLRMIGAVFVFLAVLLLAGREYLDLVLDGQSNVHNARAGYYRFEPQHIRSQGRVGAEEGIRTHLRGNPY